ncbi:aromatic ring-hydroxylating dioxygenase subunit alpha [Seongchinamella unica]|uniref:Aromatic ring-hydroxylating dioxygenase subunit alpha n=1 Tax=Seongchinamella unica TaxID=2547392 RepID=A0A4R5LU44_9GAMM|nr:aromatic ring-hydroxylating dioxygenase subunit alpha [Seongchinamella unica]TDG14851.1 aromatic ring-hydroxylating dioxygenase subunit alpha [Seongchinamella unica]
MSRTIQLDDGQIVARSGGESYQEMLDKEVNPVPDALRENTNTFLGSDNLSTDRYLSREFHEREVEKMWSKTWQVTCRETEIANPGDYFVYDIASYSIVITRTESGEIKGYHNACLHRGRQLRKDYGSAREFKCPYHGFRWSLDGDFLGAPCQWDFPHIRAEEFSLPQVQVATWGGWVFINMDLEAPSLQEYMGILPAHFTRWKPENTFKALHVEKVIECNWKVAWEAFIESYHTVQTHPQIMPYLGDSNSQYDCWGDNVSRTISPMGVVSPHLEDVDPNTTVNDWLEHGAWTTDGERVEVPEGMSAREWLAEYYFEHYSSEYGVDLASFCTRSEIMDSILYSLFPNFAPWAGFHPNLTYRMKPYGDDPGMCTMEIIFLMRFPEGTERPADCPVQKLDKDQLFSEAAGLEGGLGRVFDQDLSNLKMVQKGLRNLKSGEVVLANYQEIRIRHFHQTLDKYLNA